MFDITVWKVVNCFMITTMIVFIVKMVTYSTKMKKEVVAASMWLCIFTIDILISREVLYWLNGNTAYIVTLFKTMVYFYYFYSKIVMKKAVKKYDYALIPILGIWAGWTAPQCGGVIIALTFILILWNKFINNEKTKAIYILALISCIVGFLILYFAPGNYVRMAVFEKYNSLTFMEKIEYRINNIYQIFFNFHKGSEIGSVPFFLILAGGLLCSLTTLELKVENKTAVKYIVGFNMLNVLLYMALILAVRSDMLGITEQLQLLFTYENVLDVLTNGKLSLTVVIPYVYATFVILSYAILALYVSLKKKNVLLLCTVLASFMSQFAMVMAPESEQRTTFIAIFYLFIAISIILNEMYERKAKFCVPVILTLAICNVNLGIYAAIVYAMLYFFLNKKICCEWLFVLFIFGVLSGSKYLDMIKKYKINKEIYNDNIQRIEAFKENPSDDNKLYLRKPEYPQYSFTPLVGIKWVEEAVLDYFKLDKDTVLVDASKQFVDEK